MQVLRGMRAALDSVHHPHNPDIALSFHPTFIATAADAFSADG
jgi:hypothetical protein